MKHITLCLLFFAGLLYAQPLQIVQKPIDFTPHRVKLTQEYIAQHYGLKVDNITINPKIIVIHWTAIENLKQSFVALKPELLTGTRKDISNAGKLNVSAHFLVDRDGTIYQLMPDNWMARHVIGLNYVAIGIENVGGKNNEDDLTDAQLRANIALVEHLKRKYPHIEYLIGHHEYLRMQQTPYWSEKDTKYRTQKSDPSEKFMSAMRVELQHLKLKKAP